VIGVDLGSSGSEVAIGYPSGSAFNLAAAAEQLAVPGGGAKVRCRARSGHTVEVAAGRLASLSPCAPSSAPLPRAAQIATSLLLNADAELTVREFGDDAEKTFHRLRADGVP